MTAGGSGAARKYLRDLFQVGAAAGLPDVELLERFVRRDGAAAEAAFAALVERHGPMVLRLCRALLGDAHEAEDAFQATFLVLARRAGSIRAPGLLANWLYGVAHRTARKARARALRRRSREVREDEMPAPEAVDRGDPHDLTLVHREQARLVHEELERLPEKHRAVVVLCCLEDMSVEEAARRLRCTPGAVRGRLAEARSRLRGRLARRGFAVPSALVAAAFSAQQAADAGAAVPPALREATIRAAMAFGGKVAATGAAPGTVAATARSVSRLMVLSELKLPAMALLALVAAGAGLGALTYGPPHRVGAKVPATARGAIAPAAAQGNRRGADPRRFIQGFDWILSAVDPDRGTLSVQAGKGQFQQTLSLVQFRGLIMPSGLSLERLKVSPGARVTLDGQPADLKRLREGMWANVELAPGRLAVAGIRARSDTPPSSLFVQVVDGVDVAGRTLSFSVPERPDRRLERVRVAERAEITRVHARPDDGLRLATLGLKDLRPGTPASIGLEVGEDGDLYVSSMLCAVGDDGKGGSR